MRKELIPEGVMARLAQATRELVIALGGNGEVAHLTGLCKAHISKCCSPDYAECLPLGLVAPLEGRAGCQPITRALADMNGHALTSLADEGAPAADLNAPLMAVVKTSAIAVTQLAEALEDGALSPREAADCTSAISAAIEALTHTGRAVATRLPKGRVN